MKSPLRELNGRERPRERCLSDGAKTLSLRECLAILLGSGPRGQGCLGLAHQIVERPGGGLSDEDEERAFFIAMEVASKTHLQGIKGLGDAGQARILAAFELGRRYALHRERSKRAARHEHDLAAIAKRALKLISLDMKNEPQEWLGFIPFYKTGRLGKLCVVERGVRSHVNTDPVEFFARLLALRPDAFVLAHNHPSGDARSSEADQALTEQLRKLSRQLGISLLGHWIVSPHAQTWID